MTPRETQCLECAKRERDHARFLRRMARLDPLPPEWGVEHQWIADARSHYREALSWIRHAKVARENARYADDMRKLRSCPPGYEEAAPGEMALHEG